MSESESDQQNDDQLLPTFASTVNSALQIFAKLTRPSEKVEAAVLWNVVSEKLEAIMNDSTDAMKAVSLIVIRNGPEKNSDDRQNQVSSCSHSKTTVDKDSRSEQTSEPLRVLSKETDFRLQKILRHQPSHKKVIKEKGIESRLRKILEENQETSTKSLETATTLTPQDIKGLVGKQSFNNQATKSIVMDGDISSSDLHTPENSLLRTTDVDEMESSSQDNQDTISSGSSSGQEDNDISPENNDLSSQSSSSKDFSTRLKKVKVVEKNRWSCTSCEKQFDDYLTLQKHITSDHSVVKPFKCATCQGSFSTKSNYNVHLRKHSGERPFPCPKCSVRFTTSNNLRRHLLSHQGVKPYRCSVCDSCFAEKRSLQIHQRNHTGERPYICSECSRTFKQKKLLQSHMLTHSSEKPFLCQQCGQAFRQKAHLRSHEIRHQGDKNHACHYCKAAFVSKSDLNRHERSHRGEKFVCPEENCGKSFMRNQSLKEHLNRHLKLTPYKCSKCPMEYPQLSEYRKHIKKHND